MTVTSQGEAMRLPRDRDELDRDEPGRDSATMIRGGGLVKDTVRPALIPGRLY